LTGIKASPKDWAILCTDFTAPTMESKMQGERENAIRERAYLLWENEGRPDGKHLEHWLRAEGEVSGKEYAGVTDNGKFIEHSSVSADPAPRRRSRSR
jgi:hypothetical protein